MKALKIIKKVLDILLITIALLFIVGFIIFKAMGLSLFIVYSGSMEPTISVDDIVIVKPISINEVEEKDIITYIDKHEDLKNKEEYKNKNLEDTYVTHRVVKIDGTGNEIKLTMQGDANNTIDAIKVTKDNIYGKHIITIPNGGPILETAQSPFTIIAIIGIIVLIYLIINLIVYIKTPESPEILNTTKIITSNNDDLNVSNDISSSSNTNNIE